MLLFWHWIKIFWNCIQLHAFISFLIWRGDFCCLFMTVIWAWKFFLRLNPTMAISITKEWCYVTILNFCHRPWSPWFSTWLTSNFSRRFCHWYQWIMTQPPFSGRFRLIWTFRSYIYINICRFFRIIFRCTIYSQVIMTFKTVFPSNLLCFYTFYCVLSF